MSSAAATSLKREHARAAAQALAVRVDVEAICVFGSVARGEAKADSDIDLLVVGVDDTVTPSKLLNSLPSDVRDSQVFVTYHTFDSLKRYVDRWSRFRAHLRLEGWVLYDRTGELKRILDGQAPISPRCELATMRRSLVALLHLERFGGRFLFPLAQLYRVGRTVAFATLASCNILEFDRRRAFSKLAELHPTCAQDLATITRLAPFYDYVNGRGDKEDLPFNPVGCESEVVGARNAISRLLDFAERVDA